MSADFAAWLRLREPADAAARDGELAELAGAPLTEAVIHDLGAGTGSMTRWLAPRLPGPQHWVLHDRDAALLARSSAPAGARPIAADGSPVTVEARVTDLAGLTAADLEGADLVTASALLDILTGEELDQLLTACAGRPALFTLSVTGEVELTPADPLDAELAGAFNDHQRRTVGGRRLLGPGAPDAVLAAARRLGSPAVVRRSPWRLAAGQAGLIIEWLDGWLAAACEQRPELAPAAAAYAQRRRRELAGGRLRVVVQHTDVLVGSR